MMIVMGCCLALGVSAQLNVQQMADSIVKYQMKSGGWPKNQDWLKGVDPKEARMWLKGIGSTIDNGATTKEMETLAQAVERLDRVVAEQRRWLDEEVASETRERYCTAFVRGLQQGDLKKGVGACSKHYLGYGGGGNGNARAGESNLWDDDGEDDSNWDSL